MRISWLAPDAARQIWEQLQVRRGDVQHESASPKQCDFYVVPGHS